MANQNTPAHEIRRNLVDSLSQFRGGGEREFGGDNIMGEDWRLAILEQVTYFAPAQHGEQEVMSVSVNPDLSFEVRAARSSLKASDPLDIQTLIGFGMAVEYFEQAAIALGYRIEEGSKIDVPSKREVLASYKGYLHFEHTEIDGPKIRELLERRSVRGHHLPIEKTIIAENIKHDPRKGAISNEDLRQLALVDFHSRLMEIAGDSGFAITDPLTIEDLALVAERGYIDKMDPVFVQELVSMLLRYSEIDSAESGMIPALFQMDNGLKNLPPKLMVFSKTREQMPDENVTKILLSQAKTVGKTQAAYIRNSNGLLVFTADLKDPMSIINSSREAVNAWVVGHNTGLAFTFNAIFVEHELTRRILSGILQLQSPQEPVCVMLVGYPDPKNQTDPSVTPPKKVVKRLQSLLSR